MALAGPKKDLLPADIKGARGTPALTQFCRVLTPEDLNALRDDTRHALSKTMSKDDIRVMSEETKNAYFQKLDVDDKRQLKVHPWKPMLYLKEAHNASQAKEKARQAEIEALEKFLKEQKEEVWRQTPVPGARLSPEHENAKKHLESILNFQLEAVAISAIIRFMLGGVRTALGVQHVTNCIEYHLKKDKTVPFNEALHKQYIETPDRQKVVPLGFDIAYHKLLQLDPQGKPVRDQRGELVELPENTKMSPAQIRMLGYLPAPTWGDSTYNEIQVMFSELKGVSEGIRNSLNAGMKQGGAEQGQDLRGGMMLNRVVPKAAH